MNHDKENPTVLAVQQKLFALADPEYKTFQCRLMPTVPPENVIGVRTPALRTLAKQLAGTPDAAAFLAALPHNYYEENNLHGLLINAMKEFAPCIEALDAFLPYVDNWATCDLLSPKMFRRHLPALLPEIERWLESGKTYTVRFGLEMLMSFYLDDAFEAQYLALAAGVQSGEYYVNMMIAWFFATALAKQYDAALPYIQQGRLAPWVHNKTIQKAVESYRITPEQKDYLRTLRLKTPV